jgi:AcrR family transcriptional regulator
MAKRTDRTLGRERILNAAAPLFREKGYGATSVRDIANALGVQSSALYYHFSGKEELLYEISQASVQASLADIRAIPHGDPADRLREFMRRHLRSLMKHMDWHSVMLLEHKSLSPENRHAISEFRGEYEQLLSAIIADGVTDGSFVVNDVELSTMFILGGLNWTLIWFRPHGRKNVDEIADGFADQVLASFQYTRARHA